MKDGFRFYSTSHHAAAWILFLSLFWVFYQVMAILQLCTQMKLLLIRVPIIQLRATLPAFFIIVSNVHVKPLCYVDDIAQRKCHNEQKEVTSLDFARLDRIMHYAL